MDKTTLARVVLVSAIAAGTGLLGYFLHPAPAPQRSVKCPAGYTLNSANTCESTSPPSNSGGPPSGTQPPPTTGDDDDHGHGHDPDDHQRHDNGHHYGQEKNGNHGHHYGQEKQEKQEKHGWS